MTDIHLVAPSGYCTSQDAAMRGIERLQNGGYFVSHTAVIRRRDQRFAGNDTQRLADLNHLVQLSENDLVLAVRGGYGVTRLLADIDFAGIAARLKRSPLFICGHSDFTVFQLGLLCHGAITFSGPMLASHFGAPELDEFTWTHFWQALREPEFTLRWFCPHTPFAATGTLWGGNLAMVTSLLGTPWFPDINNGILVLEDINEPPFRIERMLLQLLYAGVLERQQAIVLGNFSASKLSDYDAGYNIASVVSLLQSKLSVALLSGLTWGHELRTVTLPIGAQAILSHNGQQASLTLSGHPVLIK